MKKKMRRGLSLLVVFLMVLTTFAGIIPSTGVKAQENAQASEQITDIRGHWAQNQISEWASKGLARGYNDGTFRPDKSITRAEFITLVNKAFGFTKKAAVNFKDVSTADWYSEEIAKAAAEGYITGYEDGTIKPQNPITRQEVAVMLSKVMKLKTDETKATDKFKDASRIPAWSKPYLDTIVKSGYMGGYPDGTIQPSRSITRAESIMMLDRAVGTLYNAAGTYGPSDGENTLSGNVTINTTGVTLQNTVIEGSLYLTAGIGDGDVTLNNVAVKGKTIVAGGGQNSIHFTNFTGGELIVIKVGGQVRIAAAGDTQIDQVRFESGGTVEGQGIAEVYLLKPGEEVTLDGDFERVVLEADAQVKVTEKTTIGELEVAETAKQAKVDIAENCTVKTLTLNAPAEITGKGTIEKARINADGAVIEQTPEKVEVGKGVKASVGGKQVSGGTTTPSGGGGGGGGGNTQPSKAAINSITVTNGTITVAFSKTVTGLTLNDFNITAKLDEQTYTLKNLTYNDSTKTFTFTPIPQTNKLQTLAITVAAASSSTKIKGSDSDTVTIEALPEEKGSIRGTVTSAVYGEPISGATITVLDTGFSVTTDVYGKYSVFDIPVGAYNIKAEKTGYKSCIEKGVVKDGETTTVDFKLEKEEGPVEVDKTELAAKIEEATTLLENTEVGEDIGNVPQANYDDLKTALNAAIEVYEDEDATQAEVDAQVEMLAAAIDDFNDAIIREVPPIEASLVPVNNFGIHDGKVYAGYELKDSEGNQIALIASNIESMTVKNPDESTDTLTVGDDSDPLLWFNVEKEAGDYVYTVETKAGTTYEATITWVAPETADWVATGGEGEHEGITYVEYKLMGDENHQVSLKEGEVKLIASKDQGEWKDLVPNADETLWFNKAHETGDYEFIVVTSGNVIYKAMLEWTAPVVPEQASLVPVNNFGIHDGKVYAGYELKDSEGNQIALIASNIESMTVLEPGANEPKTLTIGDDSDPYLWFNVEKAEGNYLYTVLTKDGITYEATLTWAEPKTAAWEATNREGIHDEITYVEYKLMDGEDQVSLKEGDVKLIASKDQGEWKDLVPNADETLWFNKAHETGDYEFIVVTKDNTIYKATLEWTAQ